MRRMNRTWSRPGLVWSLLCIIVFLQAPRSAAGQGVAGLDTPLGRRPVQLWPTPEGQEPPPPGTVITLGGWSYRAIKARSPQDGVPWQLIVKPVGQTAKQWKTGGERSRIPLAMATVPAQDASKKSPETIPIIEMPLPVWRQRMSPDLQDVVGIHFHEFVSDDEARILFTVHKVPPNPGDGNPPPPVSEHGQPGTRIEATLLAPLTWSLDQTIAVRVDPLRKNMTEGRARHEVGHSKVSQQILPAVLHGPQDWNPRACTGRRSHLVYYWHREQIGRSWTGYERNVGKLLTLRTSIVLVPPTRWSLLLPIPPERVTQRHIQQFNDAIVRLDGQLAAADRLAQSRFHAQHGEYENPGTR